MSTLQLSAQPREITGHKVKHLRREGIVPVVVYGATQEPINLQVMTRSLEHTLHAGGVSQLVELTVEGGKMHNVLIREVQIHPVTHTPIHADMYAVNMLEKQTVTVAIVPVGEAAALAAGLMVLQALDQVELEALPSDIPASIEVDITDLDPDHAIHVSDLPAINGVEYLTPADEPVFNMIATRVAEEEEVEEEEIEGAEPEVLTGGKQDEDEE